MGRNRKAEPGDVVTLKDDYGTYAVVDVRRNFRQNGGYQYRLVKLNSYAGPTGPAHWYESWAFGDAGVPWRSTMSVRIYRQNEKLNGLIEGRGCSCQCCFHWRAEPSMMTGMGKDEL
jgi:hypothetical protein